MNPGCAREWSTALAPGRLVVAPAPDLPPNEGHGNYRQRERHDCQKETKTGVANMQLGREHGSPLLPSRD